MVRLHLSMQVVLVWTLVREQGIHMRWGMDKKEKNYFKYLLYLFIFYDNINVLKIHNFIVNDFGFINF